MLEPPPRLDLEEGAPATPAAASPDERQTWEAMVRPRRRRIVRPRRSEALSPWPAPGATGSDDQPSEATSNGADGEAGDEHPELGRRPDKLLLIVKPDDRWPG
jgi:hypothetical protein